MNKEAEAIFRLCGEYDVTGEIGWDEDFNIWINCSDFIVPGAYSEPIKDIPLFEKCLKDAGCFGAELYVLRINKCLPLNISFYKEHLDKEIWKLFKMACKE